MVMSGHSKATAAVGQKANFADKVALITGSARGIGRTIAAALGHAGAKVAVCDINRDAAMATVLDLENAGIDAWYVAVDLARKGEPQRMVSEVASQCGRLDILVNNARAGARLGFMEDSEENWDLTMSVGLRAAYFASQQAVTIMAACGGGNIVNISSVSAFLVSKGVAAYHAAKAGLIQLTRYLAAQAGCHGIRVNSVLPGFIVQDEYQDRYLRDDNAAYRERAEGCHPIGRVGYSRDVANAVIYLCSESASFVTGQSIVVDGGFTIQDPWTVVSNVLTKGNSEDRCTWN